MQTDHILQDHRVFVFVCHGILQSWNHVKLFNVANQGHYYIVNSLRTWKYPIGDPVQILNWLLTWKWGCVLLWPEAIFFLVNPASPRTISIDKKKISSGTQGNVGPKKHIISTINVCQKLPSPWDFTMCNKFNFSLFVFN